MRAPHLIKVQQNGERKLRRARLQRPAAPCAHKLQAALLLPILLAQPGSQAAHERQAGGGGWPVHRARAPACAVQHCAATASHSP